MNLLGKFGRVTLGLFNVMVLLTVQNIEVLLSFVVYIGATSARHVRLMPDSSTNYVEVVLPLLLMSTGYAFCFYSRSDSCG